MNKWLFIIVALSSLSGHALAQEAVADGGLYSLLDAQQTQILNQWTSSLTKLDTQITTAQQQLTQLTNVQQYLGNPAAAAGSINLGTLTSQLNLGPTTQALQQLTQAANGAQSLGTNPQGIFQTISNLTPGGNTVTHDPNTYKPTSAVEQAYQNVLTTQQQNASEVAALKQDIMTTTQQLASAPDMATTQKLQGKLTADQAQLDKLNAESAQATAQLQAQKTLNDAEQDKQNTANNESFYTDLQSAYKQSSGGDQRAVPGQQ